MINFLGGENIAGGKLKEIGATHWLNSNTGTKESGFTGLPGGWKGGGIGEQAYWWSSTENDVDNAFYFFLSYNYNETNVTNYFPQISGGFSVRCVKDNISTLTTTSTTSVIKIFPNPVTWFLTIEYNDDNEDFKSVNILNSQGKLLVKEKAVFPRQQIDFSKFSSGYYIVDFIKSSGAFRHVKILKF